MAKVWVECDRCGEVVEGQRFREGTSGFYDVTRPHTSKYAKPGEKYVCDACMLKDESYLADYPYMRQKGAGGHHEGEVPI